MIVPHFGAGSTGRKALVYDLMEPFRPQIDREVLSFLKSYALSPKDILQTGSGICRLHPHLAKTVIQHTIKNPPVQKVVFEV